MRTELPASLLNTDSGRRADAILRSCVHCGFCNATCPTYLVEGNELDGPRGRIYLIKDMLETGAVDAVARTHLDRCLTCRACETTCPSGVAYGELLEIGRDVLETGAVRGRVNRGLRALLISVVPRPRLFGPLVALGRWLRPLLPRRLRDAVPPPERPLSAADDGLIPPAPVSRPAAAQASAGTVAGSHDRVVLLEGCVQRVATPGVNATLRQLLAARDIEVVSVPQEACCGGLALHLGDHAAALGAIARNVAALAPWLSRVDAILSTASGCGVTVKDYGRLAAAEPTLAEPAERLARLTLDVAEYLATLPTPPARAAAYRRVAWHPPCTLQHGQRVTGIVERLLTAAGYELQPVADAHLCCGSAGTYALLEPGLSGALRTRKLAALEAHRPDVIATANIGCQLHLGAAAGVPVRHWLSLLR